MGTYATYLKYLLTLGNNSAQGTKEEGEECGKCFDPNVDFKCGKCVPGLECVEDEQSELLPDLPSRCRVTVGKILRTKFRAKTSCLRINDLVKNYEYYNW